MRILVLGCGILSAQLVPTLVKQGHQVTIMDTDADSLDALCQASGAEAVLVSRPLVEELPRAKVLEADAFLALTDDDNTNTLAAQAALHLFGVGRVLCRIEDPSLNDIYEGLGVDVVNPTMAIADSILQKLKD